MPHLPHYCFKVTSFHSDAKEVKLLILIDMIGATYPGCAAVPDVFCDFPIVWLSTVTVLALCSRVLRVLLLARSVILKVICFISTLYK